MGTWGITALSNDTASDWLAGFLHEPTAPRLRAALAGPLEDATYIESDIAQVAIAAIEVIAHLRGNPCEETAESNQLLRWARTQPAMPIGGWETPIRRAFELIRSDQSELRELWDYDDAWLTVLEDLEYRALGPHTHAK